MENNKKQYIWPFDVGLRNWKKKKKELTPDFNCDTSVSK